MKKPVPVDLPAGLYLVATPIGNLRDITLRALDVLAAADLVVCEDTRVTGRLFEAYSLKKKMIPYNDHNADQKRGGILEALSAGRSVALVSDAGTPLVSDPGYRLVQDCLDLGLPVTPVPGPSAPLAALQLSGLPPDRFVFLGFLPPRSAARRKMLQLWADTPATLVMFETAPRLGASLKDIGDILGADRPAALVREITKKFEEAKRDTLRELAALYKDDPPKGELVLVVGGKTEEDEMADDELEDRLRQALETMSVKDAAALVAEETGQSKKKLYELALKLGRENKHDR